MTPSASDHILWGVPLHDGSYLYALGLPMTGIVEFAKVLSDGTIEYHAPEASRVWTDDDNNWHFEHAD